MSNIDLTSQTRHSFTKQSRDYSSGLYDLYSRIESRKDYQNIYKFSDHSGNNSEYWLHKYEEIAVKIWNDRKFQPTEHSDSIYDQVRSDAPIGPDTCSLRRTRSLAVIREETYNDLQITGIRTRRSQLIPRAKLVNRSFFKNRYTYHTLIMKTCFPRLVNSHDCYCILWLESCNALRLQS